MRWAIWYHFYYLKNVKNTHWGVLLLVKSETPPWVFSTFWNCKNDTKSRKASHIYEFNRFDRFHGFKKHGCHRSKKVLYQGDPVRIWGTCARHMSLYVRTLVTYLWFDIKSSPPIVVSMLIYKIILKLDLYILNV